MLIVEDDPNDAKLIQRAIKKARIAERVTIVTDGAAAIDYLSGAPPYDDRDKYPLPPLMVLDLKLPKKDGFEVIEWVRAQPKLKRLPVVVLTSSGATADISRAYDLGVNSYLVKPVGTDALVDILEAVKLYWLNTNTTPDFEAD